MNAEDLPMFAPLDSTPGEPGRVTRADVVACARSWLDTRYIHQHRLKGHGVDCVGLVIGVARELGLVAADFDVNGYPASPDGKSLIKLCDKFMHPLASLEMLKPGHVLVYQFHAKLGPQHMGIVGDYMDGGLSLIQALGIGDSGRVIEWNLARPRKGWKPVRGYSLPGVV